MSLREDPRIRVTEEIAVAMARLAGGVVDRLAEAAFAGGLALLAVGAGSLMPDGCGDLGECEPENAPRYRVAA